MSRTSRRCIDQERKKSDLINLPGVNKPRAGFKRSFTSVVQEEASNSPERAVNEASFPKPGTYLDAQEKREKIRQMMFPSGSKSAQTETWVSYPETPHAALSLYGGAFRTLPQHQVISPRPSPFGMQLGILDCGPDTNYTGQSRLPVT